MYISIPYCCCLQFILLSCVSKLANKFTVQLKSITRNILKCVNYKFYCSSMLDICVDRMARYVGTVQFISLLNVYRNWCFMGFTGNFSFWIYSKLSLWDHYFDVLEWRKYYHFLHMKEGNVFSQYFWQTTKCNLNNMR